MTASARRLMPSRAVLPNGMTVTSRQTRKMPALTINLSVRSGAVGDPAGLAGATYLLSRVIDRGTRARSATDIADDLDNRGVTLGIFVTRHQVSFTCTCLTDDFEPVLALMADIVSNPTVPDQELLTRRREVVTMLRQDADNPAMRAVDTLLDQLYGTEHPYARRMKGTTDSVEALTRDALLALHAARFGPAAASLAVVGDVDANRAADVAAAAFGSWHACPESPWPVPSPAAAPERRFLVVPMMNKAQTDIAYGFVGIRRADPSYHAFSLMNNVLGQYALGGRLGDSIRERQGMAYYVSSTFDASVAAGPVMVRAGVAAANVPRAIASIDEELRAIRRDGVTPKELAESKQYLAGSLPRALETNAGIAQFLQNVEFYGLGLDYDERLPDLLQAVTPDQVHEAASCLDPDRATIVVAGPYQPA